MLTILYAAVAVLALAAFYFAIIHPFVCMIECAFSKNVSGTMKFVWIAVTFFTGIIGATLYTVFGMQSTRLRKTSLLGMAAGALSFVVCVGVSVSQPELGDKMIAFAGGDRLAKQTTGQGQVWDLPGNEEELAGSIKQLDGALANLKEQFGESAPETTQGFVDQLTSLAEESVAELADTVNGLQESPNGQNPVGDMLPEGVMTSKQDESAAATAMNNETSYKAEIFKSFAALGDWGILPDESSDVDERPGSQLAEAVDGGSADSLAEGQTSATVGQRPAGLPVRRGSTSILEGKSSPPAAAEQGRRAVAPINRYRTEYPSNYPAAGWGQDYRRVAPAAKPVRNRYTGQ